MYEKLGSTGQQGSAWRKRGDEELVCYRIMAHMVLEKFQAAERETAFTLQRVTAGNGTSQMAPWVLSITCKYGPNDKETETYLFDYDYNYLRRPHFILL